MTVQCASCGTAVRREYTHPVAGGDLRVCSRPCEVEWTLRNDPPAEPAALLDLAAEATADLDEPPLVRVVIATGEIVGTLLEATPDGWDIEDADAVEYFVSRDTDTILEAEAVFS